MWKINSLRNFIWPFVIEGAEGHMCSTLNAIFLIIILISFSLSLTNKDCSKLVLNFSMVEPWPRQMGDFLIFSTFERYNNQIINFYWIFNLVVPYSIQISLITFIWFNIFSWTWKLWQKFDEVIFKHFFNWPFRVLIFFISYF